MQTFSCPQETCQNRRCITSTINGRRWEKKPSPRLSNQLLQTWGFRSINRGIKHERRIGTALIAKYNKCAGICLGDTVTQWLPQTLPHSPRLHFLPSVSQAGWRACCFWSFRFSSPSGLHFPLRAFIWLSLREGSFLWTGPTACLPLLYSYTLGSDWRRPVNMKSV